MEVSAFSEHDTDCELVKQLGFEEHPRSPIVVIQPSQSRQWLLEQLKTKARLRRNDKLAYLDAVAKQHELYDAKLFDLSVLNRCLREHIESTFFKKYNRRPNCSLDVFLYSPVVVPSKLSPPEKRKKAEPNRISYPNRFRAQSFTDPYSLDKYPRC